MKLFRAVLLLTSALVIASCGEKKPEGQTNESTASAPSATS